MMRANGLALALLLLVLPLGTPLEWADRRGVPAPDDGDSVRGGSDSGVGPSDQAGAPEAAVEDALREEALTMRHTGGAGEEARQDKEDEQMKARFMKLKAGKKKAAAAASSAKSGSSASLEDAVRLADIPALVEVVRSGRDCDQERAVQALMGLSGKPKHQTAIAKAGTVRS